jgi:hypothetical protein
MERIMKFKPDFSVYKNCGDYDIPGMSALREMIGPQWWDEECPVEGCGNNFHLGTLITHINDTHAWTFDEIADWLESSDKNVNMPTRKFVIR